MANKVQQFHNPAMKSERSYSYKPLLIGAVIKTLCEQKHITPAELAKRVGVNKGNIYRLFTTRTMALPMLFKMSEALDENLLLHYHPNVKPLPNPLQAECEQLKAENEQLKQSVLQLQTLTDENKILKAQLDVLREVMKAK
ncbi:MAG: helix-turn-helix domain-containing protein [Bacteroidota bacterium]